MNTDRSFKKYTGATHTYTHGDVMNGDIKQMVIKRYETGQHAAGQGRVEGPWLVTQGERLKGSFSVKSTFEVMSSFFILATQLLL